MTDLTPEDRARALLNAYISERSLPPMSTVLDAESVRAWLAVEAHVLASHTCPDPESYSRVKAWNALAQHPFFADCYQTEGTLVGAMLAKLDAAHNHTCEPVWRPVTRDEIQPGWEVLARRGNGMEGRWGVAHHQDGLGDWYTEAGQLLTYTASGWTCETTAPAPEPEPWPDKAVDCLEDALIQRDVKKARPSDARALLDALAARYPGVRDAIKEGEQA